METGDTETAPRRLPPLWLLAGAIGAAWTATCIILWLLTALAETVWPMAFTVDDRWLGIAYVGGLLLLIGSAAAGRSRTARSN